MKYLLSMLLLLLCTKLLAQVEIKGEVLDKQTRKGIAFATISLKNEQKNTIANASGRFSLKVSVVSIDDIIVVSAVGYAVYKIKLSNASINKPLIIELDADVKTLPEIVIASQKPKYSAYDLMRKVVNKVYKNYAHNWYELTAFFQTTTFHPWEEEHHLNLYEALVKIQDKGFETHADSSVYMEILKFRSGQAFLPNMSLSDSMLLANMMRVITRQTHYNQIYEAYTADVIRQQNAGMFSASPFRNDAVLNFDLKYDGVVTIDSVTCFRIVGTSKSSFGGSKQANASNSPVVSYNAYKFLFPPNTPTKVIDSLYQIFTNQLSKSAKNKTSNSVSFDKDIFYVNQNSLALIRHERESIFNGKYYGSWVNYQKIGKKYYPSSMCHIGPVFFRSGDNRKMDNKMPYAISTLIVKSVNDKNFKLIAKDKIFKSDAYIEKLQLPYYPKEWVDELQIPFDTEMHKIILDILKTTK